MVLQMSEMGKKISDAFATPNHEHVEGDVLSVGEMGVSKAVAFMNEMARYFDNRPTGGEDMAFWANVTNKQNCEVIAALLTSATTRIQRAEREIARCHERLEIDHVFVMGATAEDDLVRQDVPMSERHEMPDAVECRDATISLLEQDLKAAEAQLADAVKAIKEAAKGLDMVHNGLMDPTRPRQAVGEVCAHFLTTTNAFLTTIGEKPDAE